MILIIVDHLSVALYPLPFVDYRVTPHCLMCYYSLVLIYQDSKEPEPDPSVMMYEEGSNCTDTEQGYGVRLPALHLRQTLDASLMRGAVWCVSSTSQSEELPKVLCQVSLVCPQMLANRTATQFGRPRRQSVVIAEKAARNGRRTFCSRTSITSRKCSAKTLRLTTLEAGSISPYCSASSIYILLPKNDYLACAQTDEDNSRTSYNG